MTWIHRALTSGNKSLLKATLNMMRWMSEGSTFFTRELFKNVDWDLKSFPWMSSARGTEKNKISKSSITSTTPRKTTDEREKNVRWFFVQWILALLRGSDRMIIETLLRTKAPLSLLYRGIGHDDQDVQNEILQCTFSSILSLSSISFRDRMKFFQLPILLSLSRLCAVEEETEVSKASVLLLQHLCADTSLGILQREYSWSLSARIPNEKLKNRTILKFCSALRVCEFPPHLQLLLSILESAPELVIPYFESFPYAMDPRPSDKWSISIRLMSRVLDTCPFPSVPRDLELLDAQHISHAIFPPMKLDRKGLSHGIRHKDLEVRSNVLHFCRSVLQRLERFQKIVGKDLWIKTSSFGEGIDMVLSNLPEPPVFLSVLAPTKKKTITPTMEDNSSVQDIISILSSFSRVNPSLLMDSKFDCSAFLTESIAEWDPQSIQNLFHLLGKTKLTFENKGLLHINGLLFHSNVEIRQAVHDMLLRVLLSSDLFTLWSQEALLWTEQLDGFAPIFKFLQKSVHHATTHILRLTGVMYTCNRKHAHGQRKEICMSPLLLAACELAPHEDPSNVRIIQHYLNRIVVSFVHVARMDLEWIQSLVETHLGESMTNWFDLSTHHTCNGKKKEKSSTLKILRKKTVEKIRETMIGIPYDGDKFADAMFKLSTAVVSRKSTALLVAKSVQESSSILFSNAFLRLPIPMVWSHLALRNDVLQIPRLLLLSQLRSTADALSLVDYLLQEEHMNDIISCVGWIEGQLLLDFIRSELTNFLEAETMSDDRTTYFHKGMVSFTFLLLGHLLTNHTNEEFCMRNETWKEDILHCFVLENIPSYETRKSVFHALSSMWKSAIIQKVREADAELLDPIWLSLSKFSHEEAQRIANSVSIDPLSVIALGESISHIVDEMDFVSLMEWVNGLSSVYSNMCHPLESAMEIDTDADAYNDTDTVSLMDAKVCIGNLISRITTQISSHQSESNADALERIERAFSTGRIKWSIFMKDRDEIMDECVLALLMLCAKTSKYAIIREAYEETLPVHAHSYWTRPSFFSSLSLSLMLFFGMPDDTCCATMFKCAVGRIVKFHVDDHDGSATIYQYSAALISLLQRKYVQVKEKFQEPLLQLISLLHPWLIKDMETVCSDEVTSQNFECIHWLWLHALAHLEETQKSIVSKTCEWMETTGWKPVTVLSFHVWDALFASKAASSKSNRWWLQHRLHMWQNLEQGEGNENVDTIANVVMQSIVRDCVKSHKLMKRFVKLSLEKDAEMEQFLKNVLENQRISTDAALIFLKQFTSLKSLHRRDDAVTSKK
eukprot:TRINITY_DN483_c0_g1_i5.p1 TRINITY_DN483_c0_g1~~TRINITY_DN483_c0_g1_i5.p1  ORF type:complete len:1295 (+),score=333.85 TRINITY_DN483_c0_g1_i5:1928-5812(+)